MKRTWWAVIAIGFVMWVVGVSYILQKVMDVICLNIRCSP